MSMARGLKRRQPMGAAQDTHGGKLPTPARTRKAAQVLSFSYLVLRMNYDEEVILARKRIEKIESFSKSEAADERTPLVKESQSSPV